MLGPSGECNAPCGGGTKQREIFCSAKVGFKILQFTPISIFKETFERVDEGLCDPYHRPKEEEPCNEDPCRPR